MSSQLPLSRIVSPITVTISIVSAASASAADLSKSSPGSRPEALHAARLSDEKSRQAARGRLVLWATGR